MGKENEDLNDIIFKGVDPPDPEHESFFGDRSGKRKGTHFTAQEGEAHKGVKED